MTEYGGGDREGATELVSSILAMPTFLQEEEGNLLCPMGTYLSLFMRG